MNVAVIGAGHAGVEASKTLAEAGLKVSLFGSEASLPYFRPRIIALAFGQATEDSVRMHPIDWYKERKIDLFLETTIQEIDPQQKSLVADRSRTFKYEQLIIATGAGPVLPPFAVNPPANIIPLWTIENAKNIFHSTKPNDRLLIVGGGILGIEAALRARDAGHEVIIVEKADRIMSAQFGPTDSQQLTNRLTAKGIQVFVSRGIKDTKSLTSGDILVRLDRGEELSVNKVIVSIGARRDVTMAKKVGLKIDRGIIVDKFLRTSIDGIWAAGDIVQIEKVNRCSALDANMQGRLVAQNIIAKTRGINLATYVPSDGAIHFKYKDITIDSK